MKDNHVCGTPDAMCDTECMESAYRPSKPMIHVRTHGTLGPDDVIVSGAELAKFASAMSRRIEELEHPETTRDAEDAARYRFLREPGNAIVYAKDHDAWGEGASGHVKWTTSEALDAAVDRARGAVKTGCSGLTAGGPLTPEEIAGGSKS